MTKLTIDDLLPIRETPIAPWPFYEADEISAAMKVLKSGQVNYWTGQEGRKFEEEYAASVGAKYAVALERVRGFGGGVGRSGDGAGRRGRCDQPDVYRFRQLRHHAGRAAGDGGCGAGQPEYHR